MFPSLHFLSKSKICIGALKKAVVALFKTRERPREEHPNREREGMRE
jgi:hypothetical protein